MDKKKNLLEVQKKIHELKLIMIELDDLKNKRDGFFIKTIKQLGKLAKKDLVKQLEKDKASFYEKGMYWTSDHSIKWLILWFDTIAETIK